MSPSRTSSRNQPWFGFLLLTASLVSWAICLCVASARLRGLLLNSTWLAGGAIAISVPLGTLLAVAITKTSLWGRNLLERLLMVYLFVPLYVQATAWQAAAGQGGWMAKGWLAGWRGAIWVHGVAGTAWVVLFVAATLRKVPRELEEEALQDAAAGRVLLRVSLQHAVPGIVAAALWITVLCFNEIAVTDLFQVRTFAEEIYTAASLGALSGLGSESPQFASHELWLGTLAVALLVSAALTAIWIWVPVTDFVATSSDWIWRMPRGRFCLSLVVWLITAVVVGAPLLGLLGKAGAQVSQTGGTVVPTWSATQAVTLIVRSPWDHRRELGWSLTIGAVATMATMGVAIILAWALRTRRLPLLPTALALALGFAIPGPLLGVWIIGWLNHPPDSMLAPLTWCYDHTILAPVLAQFLRALPLATLILGAQFASLPQEVLDSARTEGASWWRQLLSIALPWCWPAVVATACLAMIVALGDLAATLLVVPPGVSPLSVRIFGLLHYGAEDRVSALCLMFTLVLGAIVSIAWQLLRWLNRR
ncbi:MAG: iron ABC transporter permease [Planctomycetes bacterium]|nr:iron ABC transporter permease [Planctomycetota bacterium]